MAELPSALWQLAHWAANLVEPAFKSGFATLAAAGAAGAAAFAGSFAKASWVAKPEMSDEETMRAANNFMAQKE